MARRVDLQALPRFGDAWTFLYVEHARVDREDHAVVLRDEHGEVPVPAAALSVLMLGPGCTLTHAAMVVLGDNGCSVTWCGEGGVRCYASGFGETRRAANLMQQAEVWADPVRRQATVERMYRMRFAEELAPDLTLQQIRGREGVRVRTAYAAASRATGVPWTGRSYEPEQWRHADPVNRALSAANSCLYGLTHAAIVSTGFATGLGFVHTGKLLSFVYDVADLYKAEITIPLAFEAAAEGPSNLERRVRRACRDRFFRTKLIARMVPDIQRCLGLTPDPADLAVHGLGEDDVVGIWDPSAGTLPGGTNYAPSEGPS